MKSLTVLSFILGAVILVAVTVEASNITWGTYVPSHRLLATDKVVISSGWFRKQTADVFYPPKGHMSFATLSSIKVWDWGGRKDFCYVNLIQGGPGFQNSHIALKSQRGKALNVTIEYFGF